MSPLRYPLATSLLLLLAPVACAQGFRSDDPFQSDPFARKPLEGKPITLKIQVLDPSGDPVQGVRVFGPGAVRRVETDADGAALWHTTDQQLKNKLEGQFKQVVLSVHPPRAHLRPSEQRRFTSLDELLADPVVTFRLRHGIQLHGRVIGAQDRKPIRSVSIRFWMLLKSGRDEHAFLRKPTNRGNGPSSCRVSTRAS